MQAVTPPKLRKQHKKWELEHQQMTIDIAEEKGSDCVVVSVLRELFPEVYGSVLEPHIRSFRDQAKNRESGRTVGRKALVASSALHDSVATFWAQVVVCLEFGISELRLVALAMLAECHP